MSTSTFPDVLPEERSSSVEAPAKPDLDAFVTAAAENLVAGRSLRFPIFDQQGCLLLAEGMTITQKFRDLLFQRSIQSVQIHADDLSRMTFQGQCKQEPQNVLLDEHLTKKLNEVVNSGLLFVVNSESALLNKMAHHGAENYDRNSFAERIQRNKETSIFLDNLMGNALQGKKINCGEVTRLTASYLTDITGDIDGTLASALDTIRKSTICDHCVGMALLGMALGVEMGLDAPNVRSIALAALTHDWGMARVPQEIREANRRLTDEEYYEISKHPIYTLRLLDGMCGVPPIVPLVCYQVHERPNGRGYPHGTTLERIHLMARILNVADMYNALISPRPYRPPLTPYAAMECLLRQAASGDSDPQAVRALLMVQSLFPIGSHVMLSNGSLARVLRRNGDKFTQPIVKILQDAEGKEVPEGAAGSVIDMSEENLTVTGTFPTPGTHAVGLSPEIMEIRWRSIGGRATPAAEKSDANLFALVNQPAPFPKVPNPGEALISLEDYSEKQKRLACWVLDMLDNSSELADRQYAATRMHERRSIRVVATVCLPNPETPILDAQSGLAFNVMTRDVSQGGLSFVHPSLMSQDNILIGLPVSNAEKKWFCAKIVRRREIADMKFWEYAVSFQQHLLI
jgi:HD-GYP domain-containing protein (c-di-GMP phosphodiesterase class II)